ncbi:sensor histidine kinase NtrY-like [Nitrospirillum viridazoti]|uniref:Nitrogen regulation protein n=1 Tax=Nitrospirillum viridazoti CBAmc TaxID=1441467 RepID=A0A248JQE2_9PROT|nr:PAS domain-containing sensor histidine kinase [Nitrospirillum amazonense]ASG20720.1 two-component sensor histidine kinase [Nitrospirillum amazonense CBAmc]TWB37954.1 two-component system nitrogen regulation sensor histidine kinase NtrY [Nitrospirillum amazonense]
MTEVPPALITPPSPPVPPHVPPKSDSWWRRLSVWSARLGLGNKLAVALAFAAVLSGFATYAALTQQPPFGNSPNTVSLLLTLDGALLLMLLALMARRIVGLWIERRRGLAGSRLHVRLVAVFSLLAVLPAIVMAAFSAFFFYLGLQSWFSDRVRTAVNESLVVAQAYLDEHQIAIRNDASWVANDLLAARQGPLVTLDPLFIYAFLRNESFQRSFTEAVIFDGQGRQYGSYTLGSVFQPDVMPKERLERARKGEVDFEFNEKEKRVTALIRLDPDFDIFLLLGRPVEAKVMEHLNAAQTAVREYTELEGQRFGLQTKMTLIFIIVSLLLLLVAIWAGLNFANTLITPISALIIAAERIRTGDLTARVPETLPGPEDELTSLSRAFNRMTSQLSSQRSDLVEANRQLDLRRRFTEAVLAGVSAGVIGLDEQGFINLPNQSAAQLLDIPDVHEMMGRDILAVVPELEDLMSAIRRRPSRLVEGQVQIRRGNTQRTLLVRVAADTSGNGIRGFVITFDDVSELLSAQRKAAWADVARRIAHEIKNPLTPIQLSAERLRRKYLKEIQSDPETFKAMTDTIVRHVDDIGRMVDEFSAFARMPTPVMKPQNIQELCRQAVFLQATAQSGIKFDSILPPEKVEVECDGRQISQALTNLLKNAVEAIEGRMEEDAADGHDSPPGHISLKVEAMDDHIVLTIADNGRGLPAEGRDRLTEPYVTTRAKGTGLGLAIVKKILEDHGGTLGLDDNPGGGARVTLILPLVQAAAPQDAETAASPALVAGTSASKSV